MGLWELFVLAVGLSMDAFSVAVCKGLSVCQIRKKQILTVGLYFGFFQGFMPLVGYLLGTGFQEKIQSIDHWIAFVLLSLIGINMIRESGGEAENLDASGSGSDICVSEGSDHSGSELYRNYNLCDFLCGSSDRKPVWGKI